MLFCSANFKKPLDIALQICYNIYRNKGKPLVLLNEVFIMKKVSSKKYCAHHVCSVWSGEWICFLVRKSDNMVVGFRYYRKSGVATIKGVYNLYSVPQSLRTMTFLVHDASENFLNLLSGDCIEVI